VYFIITFLPDFLFLKTQIHVRRSQCHLDFRPIEAALLTYNVTVVVVHDIVSLQQPYPWLQPHAGSGAPLPPSCTPPNTQSEIGCTWLATINPDRIDTVYFNLDFSIACFLLGNSRHRARGIDGDKQSHHVLGCHLSQLVDILEALAVNIGSNRVRRGIDCDNRHTQSLDVTCYNSVDNWLLNSHQEANVHPRIFENATRWIRIHEQQDILLLNYRCTSKLNLFPDFLFLKNSKTRAQISVTTESPGEAALLT